MKKKLMFKQAAIILIIAIISPLIWSNKSHTQTLIEDSPRLFINKNRITSKPLNINVLTLESQQVKISKDQSKRVILAQTFTGKITTIFIVIGGIIVIIFFARKKLLSWIGYVGIAHDQIGIIYKKFAINSSRRLPPGQIIALNEEPGIQAKVLGYGPHWGYPSLMYKIAKVPIFEVGQEEIGLVEAKYGHPLELGQHWGKVVDCNSFQDVKAFFDNGGQMGKQQANLIPGIYGINTEMFSVRKVLVTTIKASEIGLVEAKYGKDLKGKNFGRIVNCKNFQDVQAFFDNGGQVGKQLAILQAGKYRINPEIFHIRPVPIVRIPKGEIGLVIANDGVSMSEGQTLGRVVECSNFEDAEAFLRRGGQKGKQLAILSEGDYKINTDFFTVITTANARQYNEDPERLKVYKIESGKIGIVTTTTGKTIPEDEIAGSLIEGHNNYQDAQKFLDVGGYKGLQEEVLKEGEWKLNPWFVEVEQRDVTRIEQEEVGVIISSVGKKYHKHDDNQDKSDEHSDSQYQLVDSGYKGVENIPLTAGDYPINTRVKQVIRVPTTQIILNWSDKDKDSADYDYELKTMKLISFDGYTIFVEFTQIIRILPQNAPKMICLVGSQTGEDKISFTNDSGKTVRKYPAIRNLVSRVLTKVVSGHFKQAATGKTAIVFQETIASSQKEAERFINLRLTQIGVEGCATIITEVNLPEELDKCRKDLEKQEQEKKQAKAETQTEMERQKLAQQQKITQEIKVLGDAEIRAKLAEKNAVSNLNIERTKAQADQLHLETRHQELEMETSYQERISLREINYLKEMIATLSPELYAQIEADKLWSKALSKVKLPELPNLPTYYSVGGGNSSGGTDQLSSLFNNYLGFEQFRMLREEFTQQTSYKQKEIEQSNNSPSTPLIKPTSDAKALPAQSTISRCPVVLLLDTSSSMSGESINHLNEGITAFKQEFEAKSSVSQSVELAIITCNSNRGTFQGFVNMDNFVPVNLKAEGESTMGKGLDSALDNLESHQHYYQSNKIQYYKPWLFLIIGSSPTDNWQDAVERVRQTVEANKLNFFVIAVKDADMISLRQVAPPNTPPIMLDGFKFRELFHWLADALKNVASSKVGSELKLPPTTEWAQVNND